MKNNDFLNENFFEQQFRQGNIRAAACPSRAILQHMTTRWGVLVMVVLRAGGVKRFSELRKEIEGISERMLAQTLQNLEQDQMLIRKDYQTVPPHVEYSLTPFGKVAADKLYDLVNWLEMKLPDILLAKQSPSAD